MSTHFCCDPSVHLLCIDVGVFFDTDAIDDMPLVIVGAEFLEARCCVFLLGVWPVSSIVLLIVRLLICEDSNSGAF